MDWWPFPSDADCDGDGGGLVDSDPGGLGDSIESPETKVEACNDAARLALDPLDFALVADLVDATSDLSAPPLLVSIL